MSCGQIVDDLLAVTIHDHYFVVGLHHILITDHLHLLENYESILENLLYRG